MVSTFDIKFIPENDNTFRHTIATEFIDTLVSLKIYNALENDETLQINKIPT